MCSACDDLAGRRNRRIQNARRVTPPAFASAEQENDKLDTLLSPVSTVVASKEQVSCALGDEAAILNMKNSVYYGLDPVGARIWNLLREPRKICEVCDAIVEEYEVERERCERDVLDLLERMRSEGLIELADCT